jgi:hypothetical protein
MLRKILLGCGIVSSVLYVAGDILASLRYGGYSYTDQTYSELLADGSPVRPLTLWLSAVPYTVLVLAFAAGVWKSAGPQRAARIAGALLAGYAFAGLAGGALFRMDTREVLAAGGDDWRSTLHAPVTAVMSLLLLGAMGFAASVRGHGFRWYSYGTILTLIVFGVLTSLQVGRMEANEPTPWMGIEERINIYATMLWVAVLAGSMMRVLGSIAPRRLKTPAASPQMAPR